MTKKEEKRANLFTGTFFTSVDLHDKDGNLINPKMTSDSASIIHILQYLRYFVVKNVKSLDYVVIALHDDDRVDNDSKEKDENGKPKYKKGDLKAKHVHVLFKFLRNQGKTLSSMQKQLYKEFNVSDTKKQIKDKKRHIEYVGDEGAMLHYLTHTNQPKKTPYGIQNLYITKVNHRKKGKVKDIIEEDMGKFYKEHDTPQPNYWVTELNESLYLGVGGQSGRVEKPELDRFDDVSNIAHDLGIKWHGSAKDFDKAECRLQRQTGDAISWFLDYRKKFKSNSSVKNIATGAKPGGSAFYHGQLPLKSGKNGDLNEIEQICFDLQQGKIKLYEVKDVLTDDFGAQGALAWDKNKNGVFNEAVMDWVDSQITAIADHNNPAKRRLSTIYTTGRGGSGKDFITDLERQILTGEVDTHKMITGGKKKTPDLFKNWGNRLNSKGSDVDGSSFDCHEFTQLFDVDSAPSGASGRNQNTPYLPNFVWFTNSHSLRDFVTDSMTHSDREKYAKTSKNEKGNKVYDYGVLNDYEITENMKTQMMRRIPYYQQFKTNSFDARNQTCRLFFYVPALDEHVLFDEFHCRTLNTIKDEKARYNEALRIANRLADDIKQYDFAGFFGERQKLPYEVMKKVYDFRNDGVKNIDIYKVFGDAIGEYHAMRQIPRNEALTSAQENELFSDIKWESQKRYAELVNTADFEKRDEMEKCQFYIDLLENYATELETKQSFIKRADGIASIARYVKKRNDAGLRTAESDLDNLNIDDLKRYGIPSESYYYYQLNGLYEDLVPHFGDKKDMFKDQNVTLRLISNTFYARSPYIDVKACELVMNRLTQLIGSVRRTIENDRLEEQVRFDFSNEKYLPVAGNFSVKSIGDFAREFEISKLLKQLRTISKMNRRNDNSKTE